MRLVWFEFKKLYYLCLLRRRKLPATIRKHLQTCIRLDLRQSIPEADFVIFDTETTGLYASKGDRIVSISAVRLRQGRIDLSDTFHELVNPNRNIPSEAAVIHGILPRMVDRKPAFEEILPNFIAYIGSSILVAHHAWLDMTFLNKEMMRLYGFPIQNLILDTALLDQTLRAKVCPFIAPVKASSTLVALAERYNVHVAGHHSSFGDALTTAEIFQRMIKEAQKQGISSVKELLRWAYQPVSFRSEGLPSTPVG